MSRNIEGPGLLWTSLLEVTGGSQHEDDGRDLDRYVPYLLCALIESFGFSLELRLTMGDAASVACTR